jgi:O-antigen ligase
MKYLWLYWLPLLFLPNLGTASQTQFGTLTIADYLIGPYLVLLILSMPYLRKGASGTGRTFASFLYPTMMLFVMWAFVSTITIFFRYPYPTQTEPQIIFGLLKIAKLVLYGSAGMLTIQALHLSSATWKRRYDWALTAVGALIGATLFISGNEAALAVQSSSGLSVIRTTQVFQENPISVLIGILIVYFVAKVVDERQNSIWRSVTSGVLVLMTLGLVFAEGRGGWLAALFGVSYILFRRADFRTLRVIIVGAVVVIFSYNQFPGFRDLVDQTLQPDQEFLRQYNAGVFGVDDGARLGILVTEAPKILRAPLLGTGFFHRGGYSGIFSTGSHNFFLQMFLETGIPGGILVLVIVCQMWRHASLVEASGASSLPAKAALLTAIASGLSGEYFYGGTVLLILWLTYAPVGAHFAPAETPPIRR